MPGAPAFHRGSRREGAWPAPERQAASARVRGATSTRPSHRSRPIPGSGKIVCGNCGKCGNPCLQCRRRCCCWQAKRFRRASPGNRITFVGRLAPTHRRGGGKSAAGIAEIPACSGGVSVAAGRRKASAESRRVTELHLWVVWRPLIGRAAANPAAGIAQIPACSAGVPAVAGRRHASAESRRVTELHLWAAWRPLIQKTAANPAAGIAQIPRGT